MLTVLMLLLLSRIVSSTCVDPTTLTAPSSPSAHQFDIGGADYSFNIDPWVQGAGCTFDENLTFLPVLGDKAWISYTSGRTITISTSDVSLHSTDVTFTVTSTINDSADTNDDGYTFQIILNNPCVTTSMTAPSSPSSY